MVWSPPVQIPGVEDALTSILSFHDLQESEERYRMVFQNSPVSIWEEDFSAVKEYFDDLRKQGINDIQAYFDQHPDAVQRCAELAQIINVNQAAMDLHEAKSKEELLTGIVNTFTPESFHTFREELVCIWNGETSMSGDAVVKTLTGKRRNVSISFTISPGYEKSLSKVLVTLVDITDRKQAEEGLKEQMDEINRFNRLMVGREEKMIELKKEINQLLEKTGKPKKYDIIA
jgi:PAS domain-containing protein